LTFYSRYELYHEKLYLGSSLEEKHFLGRVGEPVEMVELGWLVELGGA